MLGNFFMLLLSSKLTFSENSLGNTIGVSNSLDSDQDRHSVGPDWGLKTVCKGYRQTIYKSPLARNSKELISLLI